MPSACRSIAAAGVLLVLLTADRVDARELRICADPANLPFSHRNLQGFENRIAEVLAKDHGPVTYVWQRMGRSFVREYINSGKCDMLLGIPKNFNAMLATEPYYRSSYVFVVRRAAGLKDLTLNEPVLRKLKIGVQVLDDDYAPPARALSNRGMQANIVGFRSTGDEAGSIVDAVARRSVDVAIVWGPLAGFFARRHGRQLTIVPVEPQVDPPGLPFTFEISMGVSKQNKKLRDELNGFLERHAEEIQSILREYGVPQLPMISENPRTKAIRKTQGKQ
jgi:mxaJ protein